MARIVLATYGSLGDLHPVVALAFALRDRGHDVVVATSENYRDKIKALGLGFHALRPDLLAAGEHVVAEIMDGPGGTTRLMRERMFPAVRDMYADLEPAVAGADLLIASELVFAAPILAVTRRVPWVPFFLAPVSLFSIFDPPVMPVTPALQWLHLAAPTVHRAIKQLAKIISHSWWRPVRTLRRELGLPAGDHPFLEGKFSPRLNLALFSPVLQSPQPDWPASTLQTGFLFFDETGSVSLPPAVAAFLAADDPPIVFTLGSAAVYIAGDFYGASARAAQQIGRRAILLVGHNPPPPNLPPTVLAWDYLPFAAIFPHAAAIVHQGGVGTTAQALRAGRPMLVVPFAHDQFDNAARVVRLGVARTLRRSHYVASRVARELARLLGDPQHAQKADQIGAKVRAESGIPNAVGAIERVLATPEPAAAHCDIS